MFPDDFFKEIYRLQGWEYRPGTSRRTPLVGHLVNRYIYKPFPPGVLEELRRQNPRTEKGYRLHKHFQFLTETPKGIRGLFAW
jgi:P63C domain